MSKRRGILVCMCAQQVGKTQSGYPITCACVATMWWVGRPPGLWICGNCIENTHIKPN